MSKSNNPRETSVWRAAQRREQAYYEGRSQSHRNSTSPYAMMHAPLWQGILQSLPEIQFRADGYYLDVGCGPNSILAFVPEGTRVGIDPLMEFYTERFVLPEQIEFHVGKIEELRPVADGRADVIFSMNNIDHVDDLAVAAKTMRQKMRDDGWLVVSVNIVRGRIVGAIGKRVDIYRIIDRTHTYHFTSARDVARLFADHFTLERYESIEHLSKEMESMKAQQNSAPDLKARFVKALKYIKNDVLLREEMFLLLFKPAS